MSMLILSEAETRSCVDEAEALACVRQAFGALVSERVVQPEVMSFDFKQYRGEVHAKGGHLLGTPYFSIKVSSIYHDNPSRGLPLIGGAVWVFDVATGQLVATLLDNSFLTELRTGAAGALATDLLAPKQVHVLAIIGCGGQARYQLAAHLGVRRPERVIVAGRQVDRLRQYAEEMSRLHGIEIEIAECVESAVRAADVIVTTTPSRAPVIQADWVRPGQHITAIGSDLPGKQELDAVILARARVVCDRQQHCATHGELQHALTRKLMQMSDVHAELGDIVVGRKPGRESDEQITVADLTGVGAQDAAIANFVTAKALKLGLGRKVDLGPAQA